jgi:hypothetical protein
MPALARFPKTKADIVINSAPDDLSSKEFAPAQFILGLVRQAQVGPNEKFVFVPEPDSVVIGGKRYMLSISSTR